MGRKEMLERKVLKTTLNAKIYKRVLRLGKMTCGGMSRVVEDSLRAYLPIFETLYFPEESDPEAVRDDANNIALLLLHPDILGKVFAETLETGIKTGKRDSRRKTQ